MFDFILSGGTYILAFAAVLTVLVFVHEYGHYKIARWNGIRVEVFSIGFGPEIWGRTDRNGTRWKVCWVPLGGYVKFFGDMNAASGKDGDLIDNLTPEERAVCFHHKKVWQRFAVVSAGPLANFAYAFVVLTAIFMISGQNFTPPVVSRVIEKSPAEKYGFQPGDRIIEVNGRGVRRFEDLMEEIYLNANQEIVFNIERKGEPLTIRATPDEQTFKDRSGNEHKAGYMGLLPGFAAVVAKVLDDGAAKAAGFKPGDEIFSVDGVPMRDFEQVRQATLASKGKSLRFTVLRNGEKLDIPVTPKPHTRTLSDGRVVTFYMIGVHRATPPAVILGPTAAMAEAVRTSYVMIERTLDYLGQIIVGRRGTEELGGPIRIAQVSGEAAKMGINSLIMMSVLLSLNLGFVNLLPIPMLDGGHLVFYIYEAIRGKPLTERMQEHALRFGFLVVLSLMVFVTWNDLVNLRVFENIASWFS